MPTTVYRWGESKAPKRQSERAPTMSNTSPVLFIMFEMDILDSLREVLFATSGNFMW